MAVVRSLGIHRVARGAGGDDADGVGIFFARDFGKFPDGLGGVRDGFRLEPVRFVKSLAEARLPALLMHRPHVAPRHVGHQQFDRVGADINDGAPHSFHEATKLRGNRRPNPSEKMLHLADVAPGARRVFSRRESLYFAAWHRGGTRHARV